MLTPIQATDVVDDDPTRVARGRRLAHRHGYKLVKVSRRSRWWHKYGPFSLVDVDTTGIVVAGVGLGQAEDWLTAVRP